MQVRKRGLGVGAQAGALTSTAGLGSDKHRCEHNNGKTVSFTNCLQRTNEETNKYQSEI